jgi:hypothetical protein
MLSEQKAIEKLMSGEFDFPPFNIRFEDREANVNRFLEKKIETDERLRADWILELEWENEKKRFLVEYKSVGTPKKIEQGIAQLKTCAEKLNGRNLLLMAPYLSEDNLNRVRNEGINAIDFSGNGIINLPGKWFVYRTGNDNKYPTSNPIKNIYQGTSSLVCRVFFAQQKFKRVKDVKEKIQECGGKVSLSTVSKVLTQLEEEMIIEKGETIKLIRPGLLLDNLSKNYEPPEVSRKIQVNIPEGYELGRLVRVYGMNKLSDENDYETQIESLRVEDRILLAAGGETYYGGYEESQSRERLFVSNLAPILGLDFYEEDTQFPNTEFLEVDDQRIYFNTIFDTKIQFPRCSPVQTYVELMTGGKREKEAAEQIRKKYILDPLDKNEK